MKGKPDYYWRKSKEEGYPARSVFKLQEIQQKHRPVRPGSRVLDLGASPGSWSLYLLDMLAGGGSVTGVDLNNPDAKLLARKNYRFIQGDFTAEQIVLQIREAGPFDVVVSDAAPSTTGNRTLDTARSADIARQVLAICATSLAPGGSCVLKIFQGGEEREVLGSMRRQFSSARAFKPKASRSDSMETYFIGLGFTPAALPG
ncbi:MAG: RlmE family RNA methyltransferase [Spirochaetia bacterium]|jgi:23S rRNA (uridine2552-2'-O)-methyltransferase